MAETQKLAIIIASEEYEKSHVASMIASVAAVSGVEVSMFITMNAVFNYLRKNVEKRILLVASSTIRLRKRKPPCFMKCWNRLKCLEESRFMCVQWLWIY